MARTPRDVTAADLLLAEYESAVDVASGGRRGRRPDDRERQVAGLTVAALEPLIGGGDKPFVRTGGIVDFAVTTPPGGFPAFRVSRDVTGSTGAALQSQPFALLSYSGGQDPVGLALTDDNGIKRDSLAPQYRNGAVVQVSTQAPHVGAGGQLLYDGIDHLTRFAGPGTGFVLDTDAADIEAVRAALAVSPHRSPLVQARVPSVVVTGGGGRPVNRVGFASTTDVLRLDPDWYNDRRLTQMVLERAGRARDWNTRVVVPNSAMLAEMYGRLGPTGMSGVAPADHWNAGGFQPLALCMLDENGRPIAPHARGASPEVGAWTMGAPLPLAKEVKLVAEHDPAALDGARYAMGLGDRQAVDQRDTALVLVRGRRGVTENDFSVVRDAVANFAPGVGIVEEHVGTPRASRISERELRTSAVRAGVGRRVAGVRDRVVPPAGQAASSAANTAQNVSDKVRDKVRKRFG